MIVNSLILASSSVYRKQLLSQLRLTFESISPDVDESALPNESLEAYVGRLAVAKANKIACQFPNALVIGCDQAATIDGTTFISKPETPENARAMLKELSGKTVTFLNGLAVVHFENKKLFTALVPTQVTFRELTEQQIECYLQKEDALHCAGGLKSEGLGIALCKKIENNDPTALIGLPLITLCDLLAKAGLNVLESYTHRT